MAAYSPRRVNRGLSRLFGAHTLQLPPNYGFNLLVHWVIVAAGRLVRHFNPCTPECEALTLRLTVNDWLMRVSYGSEQKVDICIFTKQSKSYI